jgi:putative SOS response-associated peptidase YedK
MCGAYSLNINKKLDEVYDEHGMHKGQQVKLNPRYNMRPGQKLPVVTNESGMVLMLWGLIPHWSEGLNYKYKSINARAETVAQKPSFKKSLANKRCLIPATGFYEPDKITVTKPPYPWHYFELKGRAVFAFAGLYDEWTDGKTTIKSFTIITTEPNELVGKVHDRMPVILEKEDEQLWMNPDMVEPEQVLPLLKPYPAEKMRSWRVGDAARDYKNDNPDLIKPV